MSANSSSLPIWRFVLSQSADIIQQMTQDFEEIASRKPTVMVAMPAYNEERRVGATVSGVKPYADVVVVVDDGSKDKTVAVAEEAGAVVVRHRRNKGYGGALNTIFSTAKKYKPDILVIIDSDGQHNPEDVPRFVAKIGEGYDVVIGSRFLTQESKAMIPGYRKLGMKVLDTATDMVTNGAHVSDSQSGFRAYTREAYNVVNISGNGMSAGSEILMQISDRKLPIGEIPISVRYDLEDTSSQNPIRHGVSVLMNLVRFISIRRPMTFFGISGSLVLFVGLVIGIWAVDIFMTAGSLPLTMTLIGGLVVIAGLLLMTTGLILYSISQMVNMVVVGKY